MKNSILFIYFLFLCLLSGCFEDAGNYDYKDLNAPNWQIDVGTSPIRVTCNEGGVAKFKGHDYFKWDMDSTQHEANVRYEWKLRDVVFGREADFEIKTDSLIKILEPENPFNENAYLGTFSIIDKTTGITFMARFALKINPRFKRYDLLVLSENGDQSRLSHVTRKPEFAPDGITIISNEFRLADKDVFKTVNGSEIPGRPIALVKAMAKNVGSNGSMTILTDKVAYVINNENMVKVSEIKDEFLNGTLENLNVVDRHDCENYTYVTTCDGRMFRRIMSKNYLGGRFVSEPYSIDAKGYKVLNFGHSASGLSYVPCYDEKNRRVLRINFQNKKVNSQWFMTNTITPVIKGAGKKDNIPPVWEMPEGSEVLYLTSYNIDNWSGGYSIIYNGLDGNTYIGDFVLSPTNVCQEIEGNNVIFFPGGRLDKSSLFLTSIIYNGPQKIVVYTKGNEIRYVDRNGNVDYSFIQCDAKVTYIGYITYYGATRDYNKLMVGLENGKFLIYEFDRHNYQKSVKLLAEFNVGGKVVSAKEPYNVYNGDAY